MHLIYPLHAIVCVHFLHLAKYDFLEKGKHTTVSLGYLR